MASPFLVMAILIALLIIWVVAWRERIRVSLTVRLARIRRILAPRLIITVVIAGGLHPKFTFVLPSLATFILVAIRPVVGHSLVKAIALDAVPFAVIVINELAWQIY